MRYHAGSCRAVQFSPDGHLIFSVSSDRSIATVDLATGTLLHQVADAHKQPINCLAQYGDNMLCTGDDDGEIKIWDVRMRGAAPPVMTFSLDEHTDFVSDLCAQAPRNVLLSTGGDGCLCVWDMRKGALQMMSEQIEDELLSLVVMKRGKKVVCGSQEGVLEVFTWGLFGEITDRFPGHPNSVDAMLKIDEDVIVTGSSDGLIRVVQIQPNKLLGVLGEHDDEFPIEQLALSRDQRFIASCSHDQTVRFWSATDLFESDGSAPIADEEEDEDAAADGMAGGDDEDEDEDDDEMGAMAAAAAAGADSDDDEDDESDEEDEDEDSDDERPSQAKKKESRKPPKPSARDKQYKKSNFFSGL